MKYIAVSFSNSHTSKCISPSLIAYIFNSEPCESMFAKKKIKNTYIVISFSFKCLHFYMRKFKESTNITSK